MRPPEIWETECAEAGVPATGGRLRYDGGRTVLSSVVMPEQIGYLFNSPLGRLVTCTECGAAWAQFFETFGRPRVIERGSMPLPSAVADCDVTVQPLRADDVPWPFSQRCAHCRALLVRGARSESPEWAPRRARRKSPARGRPRPDSQRTRPMA